MLHSGHRRTAGPSHLPCWGRRLALRGERSRFVAKQVSEAMTEQRPKRKLLRKLKRSQLSHDKAERKVGKLRLELEQAETRLAQRAQRLLLVQARIRPVDAPNGSAPDQDGEEAQP